MQKLSCPGCGQAMSLFTFMQAATPWHLQCGHCRLKLRQDRLRGAFLFLAAGVGMLLGAFCAYLSIAQGSLLIGPLLFIAGLLLFELTAFWLLPRLGVGLERRET